MSKYMDEFKEFIAKGNVMDMAVGVIIGGAFTGIVTSLTDNIINFLIVAFVVFNLVKAVNGVKSKVIKEAPAEEPAPVPVCPSCLEEVKEGATRCPHCGGEIPGGAHAA